MNPIPSALIKAPKKQKLQSRESQNKEQQEKRKRDVDIARGLAIFSVVYGHIVTGLTSQIIYLFHMPFFFIVSGYFHKVDRQEGRYFRKKCLSLLVPYVIYLHILQLPLLSRLISRIVENPSIEGVINFFKMLLKLLYGGETLRGATGVFWFVTCLFLVQQLFNFLSNRIQSKRKLFTVAIALYGLAYLDQISPVHIVPPFAANVVACAFIFYTTGAFFGDWLLNIHANRTHRMMLVAAIAITIFCSILISSGNRIYFDMKHGYYGYFILSPLAAIAITKLLMLGAHKLTQYKPIGNTIAFVGTASMTIMYVHLCLEMALPEVLYQVPILKSIIIVAICCLLHTALTTNSWTKRLFLGRRLKPDSNSLRTQGSANG